MITNVNDFAASASRANSDGICYKIQNDRNDNPVIDWRAIPGITDQEAAPLLDNLLGKCIDYVDLSGCQDLSYSTFEKILLKSKCRSAWAENRSNRYLDVRGTKITDDLLWRLAQQARGYRYLDLSETTVSQATILLFCCHARPGLTIALSEGAVFTAAWLTKMKQWYPAIEFRLEPSALGASEPVEVCNPPTLEQEAGPSNRMVFVGKKLMAEGSSPQNCLRRDLNPLVIRQNDHLVIDWRELSDITDDDAIARLAKLPDKCIDHVDLGGCTELTDSTFEEVLSKCREDQHEEEGERYLNLRGTKISDDLLWRWAWQVRGYRYVDLRETKADVATIVEFCKHAKPGLKIVLSEGAVSAALMTRLKERYPTVEIRIVSLAENSAEPVGASDPPTLEQEGSPSIGAAPLGKKVMAENPSCSRSSPLRLSPIGARHGNFLKARH